MTEQVPSKCPHCEKILTLRQDEKGPNAADMANNGAHVDLCKGQRSSKEQLAPCPHELHLRAAQPPGDG